jgi:hypothetical protein
MPLPQPVIDAHIMIELRADQNAIPPHNLKRPVRQAVNELAAPVGIVD